MLMISTLVSNARRLGHGTHTVAAAASFLGLPARSLCCWCAESVPGPAHRTGHGECESCSYVGEDCLVIEPAI